MIIAPLPAYLIETDECPIIYDSGVDPDIVEDPKATWKGLLNLLRPNISPTAQIVNRLMEIGLTPDDIDYVVQSQLHFDYAGGVRFFPRSKILFHRDEFRFTHNPDPYARGGYLLKDFHYPDLHWEFIDGDRQLVLGVTIVLAHGHTPGGLSLVVGLPEEGTIVLANDCIGLQKNLDKMILSGVCWVPGLAYQAIL
jgi:N-acyl homoserine lactone hydrolase